MDPEQLLADENDPIFAPLEKIKRDLKKASATMIDQEAGYLVKMYYTMQLQRIGFQGRVRAMEQALQRKPHEVLDFFMGQSENLETMLRGALGEYAKGKITGRWALQVMGIGPVIAAGLLSHINMEVWRCSAPDEEKLARKKIKDQCTQYNPCNDACQIEPTNTVSRVWRYAGLDPTVKWEKGKKRPWNAALKVLCWKIGQSFVKVSSSEKDVYGQYYKRRKLLEIQRNDTGLLSEQAENVLKTKNIGKTTEAYQWYSGCYPAGTMGEWATFPTLEAKTKFLRKTSGGPGSGMPMLPPAHIQARAERYAVKIFIANYHHVNFRDYFGKMPPILYILTKPEHTHELIPPDWPEEWGKFPSLEERGKGGMTIERPKIVMEADDLADVNLDDLDVPQDQ